jgi:hypothetical protein
MRFRNALGAFSGFVVLTTSIVAQSEPTLTNIIQSDGNVKALYESQAVVTTQFALFHDNWARLTSWNSTGNGTTSFERVGQLFPGTITAKTSIANIGDGSQITFNATPSRDVLSNDDHMNVMFDEAFWAGSTFHDGMQSFTFSPNFSMGFGKGGFSRTLTITRPDGFRLTIETPGVVQWACQDSRRYSLGFELRIDERFGNWPVAQTRTYQATFRYTRATPTNPDSEVVVAQSAEWIPLQNKVSVATGSALDWRPASVQPAGSKGWLIVNSNGKFAFSSTPTVAERFYGANLAHYACFPDRPQAIAMADNLAKLGYNAVRLHHFDYVLTRYNTTNSLDFDPEHLNKLNNLIAELKKRGIYISIDLHSFRAPLRDEVFPGSVDENEYKMLLLASAPARQNYLEFASRLLNTTNPYTGLKWKDEPAIAWVNLSNENNPLWATAPRPELRTALEAALGGSWAPNTENGSRAAIGLAKSVSDYLTNQLRAMGMKSLVSNLNAGFERATAIGRANLDFVDNHLYFAHPDGFGLPLPQKSTSPLRKTEEIGWFAASRIKGKPFTVTEFDAVAPNQFRGEFGLMVGALGVIQNWDGIWRFQYADNVNRALMVNPMHLFSIAADPIGMATERAIVALYLRRDLQIAEAPFTVANPLGSANQLEIRDEAVVRQSVLKKPIEQMDTSISSGSGVVFDGNSRTSDGTVVTDLNSLSLKINAGKTAAVVGSQGTTQTAGDLTVTFDKTRASAYVTSLDGMSINTSKRMLLAHMTDVQNTGARFNGQERRVLTSWGTLPHLMRDGIATVTLGTRNARGLKIYRLDFGGQRTSTVPFTKVAGGIQFRTTVRDPLSGNAVIYYEIATR